MSKWSKEEIMMDMALDIRCDIHGDIYGHERMAERIADHIAALEKENKELREMLNKTIKAWETLPYGQHHMRYVEIFLRDTMGPAIDDLRHARELLRKETE